MPYAQHAPYLAQDQVPVANRRLHPPLNPCPDRQSMFLSGEGLVCKFRVRDLGAGAYTVSLPRTG